MDYIKNLFRFRCIRPKCIISDVDNNTYCVSERNKIQLVADLLAKVTTKLKLLVKHMESEFPKRDNVKRLVENFNPKKIYETLPTSKHTAYSENKVKDGILKPKENGTQLIDENTLTFVAIHELHILLLNQSVITMVWNNFKFLLEEAKKLIFIILLIIRRSLRILWYGYYRQSLL